MGLFVFSLSCVVRLANPGTRAKQNVPFGSGFSGPWWIYWAGSLHENRYSGLLLSNTNLIPRPRLLSAIPKPSPIPELKDISTGKQKCGYFNALYLPWARFKLFDFLACGIGVLACFPKKKKSSSRFSSCFFRTCKYQRKEEGERERDAAAPFSSYRLSHPPGALTTTHIPRWWGGFPCQSRSPSRVPHFLTVHIQSASPISSTSKDPNLSALGSDSVIPSPSDPTCPPHIRPCPISLLPLTPLKSILPTAA